MVNPVKSDACKHQFCEECIQNAFHGDYGRCPVGQESIDKQTLMSVDTVVIEKLNQLQVFHAGLNSLFGLGLGLLLEQTLQLPLYGPPNFPI